MTAPARDLPHLDRIGGRPVLFVMAAPAEYGPALRRRITPLTTGVGPVESAVVVAAALARLDEAGQRPAAVVSLGSAGSRMLEQGAVFQARSVCYRDMDASPLGFPRGITPFLDQPACIDLPVTIPGIPQASLSTGGNIVSGAAYDLAGAEMVDMESYAVCRACMVHAVPKIGLRGISDGAAPLTGMLDWTRYLDLIDGRLAEAVRLLEAAVGDGLLD